MSQKYPSIRTDNISCIHQYDLEIKLRMATHPFFDDKAAQKLVKEEIEKRKKEGEWLVGGNNLIR